MNLYMNNQSGSSKISPEKMYTQHEVDDLLEKREDNFVSETQEIQKELRKSDEQKRSNNRAVAKLVKKSNRILVSISAVFPFDFFPDSINVEEGRISVIKRHLLSSEVHSVDIKDVSNVFINTMFIFSQLEIVSKTFEDNEVRIKFLRPKDAIFARRIIEGLRVFIDKNIDTSDYSKEELIEKLEELSSTNIVT